MNFFEIALLSALTGLAVMFYYALKDRSVLQVRLYAASEEIALLNRFYNKGRDALHKERQINDELRKELKVGRRELFEQRKELYEYRNREYVRRQGMMNDMATRGAQWGGDPVPLDARLGSVGVQFRSQDFSVVGQREGDGIVGVGAGYPTMPAQNGAHGVLQEPGDSLGSSNNLLKQAEDDGKN